MKEIIKKSLENVGVKSLIECADNLMGNLDETEFKSWKLFSTENYDYYLVMGWNDIGNPDEFGDYENMDYISSNGGSCIGLKICSTKLDEVANSYDSFDSIYKDYFEYKIGYREDIEYSFNLLVNDTSLIDTIEMREQHEDWLKNGKDTQVIATDIYDTLFNNDTPKVALEKLDWEEGCVDGNVIKIIINNKCYSITVNEIDRSEIVD